MTKLAPIIKNIRSSTHLNFVRTLLNWLNALVFSSPWCSLYESQLYNWHSKQ